MTFFRSTMLCRYEEEGAATYSSARLWDDGVIDPADSRRVVGLSLAAAMNGYRGEEENGTYGVFRM